MLIQNAFYPRALPGKIMIISPDNHHFIANLSPFRHITPEELKPMPVYDHTKPERYWDEFDAVPDHVLPFYGLKKEGKISLHDRLMDGQAKANQRNSNYTHAAKEKER